MAMKIAKMTKERITKETVEEDDFLIESSSAA